MSQAYMGLWYNYLNLSDFLQVPLLENSENCDDKKKLKIVTSKHDC